MQRKTDCTDALKREIKNWPNANYHFEPGAKHTKVIISMNGQTRKTIMSKTNKLDHRASKNFIRDIRQLLRSMT